MTPEQIASVRALIEECRKAATFNKLDDIEVALDTPEITWGELNELAKLLTLSADAIEALLKATEALMASVEEAEAILSIDLTAPQVSIADIARSLRGQS